MPRSFKGHNLESAHFALSLTGSIPQLHPKYHDNIRTAPYQHHRNPVQITERRVLRCQQIAMDAPDFAEAMIAYNEIHQPKWQ